MVQVRMYTFPYISLISIYENIQHTHTNNDFTSVRCEDQLPQLMHTVQAGKGQGVNPTTLAFAIRLHCISRLSLFLSLWRPAIPALTEDEKHGQNSSRCLTLTRQLTLPYPSILT